MMKDRAKEATVAVLVRMPPRLKEKIDRAAYRGKVSLSEYVRRSLEESTQSTAIDSAKSEARVS